MKKMESIWGPLEVLACESRGAVKRGRGWGGKGGEMQRGGCCTPQYLEGIGESLLLEQSDFLFFCGLSLVLQGAVLPDLDPSIAPTRGDQPLLGPPHSQGPHLVLMPIKGIQALSAAHIPQLHQAICAAGKQLHNHKNHCHYVMQ